MPECEDVVRELGEQHARPRCKECKGVGYIRFEGKREHYFVCPKCWEAYAKEQQVE